jgi:hypothetical protein
MLTELDQAAAMRKWTRDQIDDAVVRVATDKDIVCLASWTHQGNLSQYLMHWNLPPTGGGPGGAYDRDLFSPYERSYGLEQIFAPVTRALPGTFADYLMNQPTGTEAIYGRAREIMSSLYGAGQAERARLGLTFEAGQGLSRIQPLSCLLELALRPYFGSTGGPRIASRLPVEQELFAEEQRQGRATAPSFLDYLREKYDLGRFFGAPAQ